MPDVFEYLIIDQLAGETIICATEGTRSLSRSVFQAEDPYLAKSASNFAYQQNPITRAGPDLTSVGRTMVFTNSSG